MFCQNTIPLMKIKEVKKLKLFFDNQILMINNFDFDIDDDFDSSLIIRTPETIVNFTLCQRDFAVLFYYANNINIISLLNNLRKAKLTRSQRQIKLLDFVKKNNSTLSKINQVKNKHIINIFHNKDLHIKINDIKCKIMDLEIIHFASNGFLYNERKDPEYKFTCKLINN